MPKITVRDSELIALIKDKIGRDARVVNSEGARVYGRIIICLQDGQLTHIEKTETFK